MNTLKDLDPAIILRNGNELKLTQPYMLPEQRPELESGYRLVAVLGGGTWQKVRDVTESAEYAELLREFGAAGCPFTVTLYNIQEHHIRS